MNNNRGLLWFAVIVGLAALLISLLAYTRSGEGLRRADDRAREISINTSLQLARFRAAAELTAIQVRQATRRNYDQFEEDVAEVRQDLAGAYREAGRETSEEWREVEAGFNDLEARIREESADALAVLENAIRLLKQDVRTDEDG